MFMYCRLPQRVPAMCLSRPAASIKALWPSGKLPMREVHEPRLPSCPLGTLQQLHERVAKFVQQSAILSELLEDVQLARGCDAQRQAPESPTWHLPFCIFYPHRSMPPSKPAVY